MAADIPSVHALQRPEKVHDLVRQDGDENCLGCKIVGSGAFLGLAAYSYFSGMSQLEKQRHVIMKSKSIFGMGSRKFGIFGISAAFAWMGLWRAFK